MVPACRALGARSLALLVLLALSLLPAPASAAECDRACLGGLITQYVDALVAHDPARLPLADKPRFNRGFARAEAGRGTVGRRSPPRASSGRTISTPRKQIAATHVHLMEGAIPVLYSVLLHVKDGRIAGIETLVQRILPDSRFQPTELGKPLRGMNDPVPAGAKQPPRRADPHRADLYRRTAHRQLRRRADALWRGSLSHRERRDHRGHGMRTRGLRHAGAADHEAPRRDRQRGRGGRGDGRLCCCG
ncbi:MAG: hypothetical protein WDN24_12690 [Sphingomonas sp.]